MSQADVRIRIEDALAYLCRANVANFYALTVNSLERVYTKAVPTMGVSVKDSKYVLYVNPEFTQELSFKHVLMVLEHEMLHLVLNHIPRMLEARRAIEGERIQHYFFLSDMICADLAVNSLALENHPKQLFVDADAVLPEYYGLPRGQSYEWYLGKMIPLLEEIIPDPQRLIKETVDAIQEKIDAAGGMPPDSILGEVYASVNKVLGVPTTLEEALLSAEISEETLPDGTKRKVFRIPDHILEGMLPEERKKYDGLVEQVAQQIAEHEAEIAAANAAVNYEEDEVYEYLESDA